MTRAVLAALALAAFVGCGETTPPPAAPKRPAPKVAAPEPKRASLPPGHLARDQVDDALSQGPPWLLRRIPVEESFQNGKFKGWRVLSVPAEWTGIDLKPGDVVTAVNGLGLERPDDLFTAWSSLAVASDLKVAYEREGALREMVFHIDGVPAPAATASATASAAPKGAAAKDATPAKAAKSPVPPPERPRPTGKPWERKTIVITEESTLPSDADDDASTTQ